MRSCFRRMLERYKDQVHIVYRDFPLSQHPWAMHAAIDANCLAAQNPTGYWNFVDYVHAHASRVRAATSRAWRRRRPRWTSSPPMKAAKQKVNMRRNWKPA